MNPLLLDVPESITSERLIIRAPQPGDGAAMNAAIHESLAELRPWMPWANQAPSLDESEAHVRRGRARWQLREDLPLLLFLKDGTYVGGSGLHRINWDVPKFEIGYWLRTSMHGNGYMTEAVNAIAAFAFDVLKARRVEIRMDDRNTASWRVAERCGFTQEALLRNDTLATDGTLRDTRIYARVR
jgi:RimJ/RimL family protein N-acetyltransferase